MLILLPLLITWIGVAFAMHTYGKLLAADPTQAAKPFVQLWQEGFDGRTWVTLTLVAVLDAAAILAVIGMSWRLAVLRHRLDVTIPEREAGLWNRLQGNLSDASIHLARASFDPPSASTKPSQPPQVGSNGSISRSGAPCPR